MAEIPRTLARAAANMRRTGSPLNPTSAATRRAQEAAIAAAASRYRRDRAFAVGALTVVNGQEIGRTDTPTRAAAFAAYAGGIPGRRSLAGSLEA